MANTQTQQASTQNATVAQSVADLYNQASTEAPASVAAWEGTDLGHLVADSVQTAFQGSGSFAEDFLTGLQVRQAKEALVAMLATAQAVAPAVQAMDPLAGLPLAASASTADPDVVQGLRILKTGVARDFSAIKGADLFANLAEFEHVGLDQVSAAVDALPRAESVSVVAQDGKGDWSRFQGIRNAATGQPWAVQSEGYGVVQSAEALAPMMEAAQAHGLHLMASLETTHDGARVKGRALIANPEHTFTALQDSQDPIMLGFRFSTSHDGSGSVKLQPFAVRVVCLNDNTWGEWMDGVSVRHTRNASQAVADLGDWLAGLLDQVPNIKAKVQAAARAFITPTDAALAVLGLGLPVRHLANWAPDFGTWEPVPDNGPTLWSTYNSLTAYLTHSPKVGGSTDSQEALLDLAAGLLDPATLADLIVKGKAEAEALQAKRDAQKAKQEASGDGRVTVPVVAGIIG